MKSLYETITIQEKAVICDIGPENRALSEIMRTLDENWRYVQKDPTTERADAYLAAFDAVKKAKILFNKTFDKRPKMFLDEFQEKHPDIEIPPAVLSANEPGIWHLVTSQGETNLVLGPGEKRHGLWAPSLDFPNLLYVVFIKDAGRAHEPGRH